MLPKQLLLLSLVSLGQFSTPLFAYRQATTGCEFTEDFSVTENVQNDEERVHLTSLPSFFINKANEQFQIINNDTSGQGITLGNRTYYQAIVTDLSHRNQSISYILNRKYTELTLSIGLITLQGAPVHSRAIFEVYADGNRIYHSEPVDKNTFPEKLRLNINRAMEIELWVKPIADNGTSGRITPAGTKAVWAEPLLTADRTTEDISPAEGYSYEIKTPDGFGISVNKDGRITSINEASGNHLPLCGQTRLGGCEDAQLIKTDSLNNGGFSFTHLVSDNDNNRCYITEYFRPEKNAIKWTVEISGESSAWSTSVIPSIKWPANESSRYWTAWSSPDPFRQNANYSNNNLVDNRWKDPLVTRPFSDVARWFGCDPAWVTSTSGNLFSIPIVSIIDSNSTYGYSFVQSPDDPLLYLKLITTREGLVEFQHRYHRIDSVHTLHFTMYLVQHEKDWRSGLAWMTRHYPDYFEPVESAKNLFGLSAYTTWINELDTLKLRKMGFKFNWKTIFDSPYPDMFMPPAKKWKTFGTPEEAAHVNEQAGHAPYQGGPIRRKDLEIYSRKMQDYGFKVLNYFNVTEFGTDIKNPGEHRITVRAKDLWKNPNDFLYGKISDGILYNEDDTDKLIKTWEGGIVMDPGAFNFQNYLVDQGKRMLRFLPSSAGICIDRLDWLTFFNTKADDGATWYNDAPARSLFNSWRQLMSRLGPLFRGRNKAIFVNAVSSVRLDIMKYVDGIYDEHNDRGAALNVSTFLGLYKPINTWTTDERSLQPDPDFYFQRFLYLGAFPTAPLPFNNHAIRPSQYNDSCYLSYGHLFQLMDQRRWVLLPKVVAIKDELAKVNIFSVPDGYVLPIVLANDDVTSVELEIDHLKLSHFDPKKIEVFLPATDQPISPRGFKSVDNRIVLDVPLKHRCAVVKIPTD